MIVRVDGLLQNLEISGRLEKLGGRSVTIVYEITNLSHGERATMLRRVAVCFDTKARKSVACPDAWRTQTEAMLAAA